MKIGTVQANRDKSSFRIYRDLYYGNAPLSQVIWTEFVMLVSNAVPGALGLLLRRSLYPSLFGACGQHLAVGRNVTLRHPCKIRLGDNVIVDDGCLIDAKGDNNNGITIGDNVFIGRNTSIYCKNGDIHIGRRVNISSNCTVFSSNKLTIEDGTIIGAYSYLLSGGEYDYTDATDFADQSGTASENDLVIGANSWIGARVTILDDASLGDHCVVGAGAVVTKPIPSNSLALGVPARVVKTFSPSPGIDRPEYK
ncbi:MAG: acyltransferase [Lentisphaerae bacterium]|nr:acyltransferase [Lentisphaerota bacterium]